MKVRSKTADQVASEFANTISRKSADGCNITLEEFMDYYKDVNACFPLEKEEQFL